MVPRPLLGFAFTAALGACSGDAAVDPVDDDTDGDTGADTDTDTEPCDDPTDWFRDADNDTYGVGDESIRACAAPPGYAERAGDCNDGDPTVHPDAPDAPDDGLWGSGAAFPADSCKDLEARVPATSSGTHWLRVVRPSDDPAPRIAGAGFAGRAPSMCLGFDDLLPARAHGSPSRHAA